jgi:phosphatidylinositol glycan class A protein
MVDALSEAVSISRRIVPQETHERVRSMYSWLNVAHRTEIVYDSVALSPTPSFAVRLLKYASCGPFSGLLAVLFAALLKLFAGVCEYVWPPSGIERCVDGPWLQDCANAAGLRVSHVHGGSNDIRLTVR